MMRDRIVTAVLVVLLGVGSCTSSCGHNKGGCTGGDDATGDGGVIDAGGDAGACATSADDLLLGWYTGAGRHETKFDEFWEEMLDARVNFIVAYTNTLEEDPELQYALGFVERAQQRGVKVALQVPTDALEADDQPGLHAFASASAAYDNLYGWHVDEPGCCGSTTTPELLANAYDTMKAVKDLPFVVVRASKKSTCKYEPEWLPAIDVVMSENYPISDGTPEFEGIYTATEVAKACATNSVEDGRLGYIAILQGFGLNPDGSGPQFEARNPTYRELRYMLFTTLVRDAGGVVFWVYYRSDDTLKPLVNAVLYEAGQLAPAIVAGTEAPADVSVTASAVGLRYYSGPCGNLLIAVNEAGGVPGTALNDVTFTLSPDDKPSEVRLLFEDRDADGRYVDRTIATTMADGRATFTDDFGPYEVHLYTW